MDPSTVMLTSTAEAARERNGASSLRLMRKGTKSCQECRRRKIKCNYTKPSDEVPGARSETSDVIDTSDRARTHAATLTNSTARVMDVDTKCIECLKHNRTCEIQGYVDPASVTSPMNGVSRTKKHIYKRRRGVADSPDSPGRQRTTDDDGGRQRVKVRVHRMHSMVERLAREKDSRSASTADGLRQTSPYNDALARGKVSSQGTATERSEVVYVQPGAESAKEPSPLLTQLFNNEVFTQTPFSPAILTQKKYALTFLDGNSVSDVEKLRSTISSEPNVLDVLDISTHWWVAWRDRAFALHEAFSREAPWMRSFKGSSSGPSERAGSPRFGLDGQPAPVSLRDFVRVKLSQDHAIPVATGLFCIAMSLQQLRPGVDDLDLHLSLSPSELAGRIVLAVDAIVLSPSSSAAYKRDPGILLLFMMRAKMYAETDQLRKSWLVIRKATETAEEIGFTDIQQLPSKSLGGPYPSEEEINLFHRQRFVGSILEMDHFMSMVLGFPHAEDKNFSDRLALAVLRDQVSGPGQEPGTPAPVDIKVRALRRVVAVVAGRVNDRNAASEPIETKLQSTMNIQAVLDEAAAGMPPAWWDLEAPLDYSDPFAAHQHLMAQIWYWQVQSFLHMPYMLASSPRKASPFHNESDPIPPALDPYELNRYLCLQGCRGMLRAFHHLRSEPSLAVYICPCEDFQGVFSACILMVGLLLHRTNALSGDSLTTPAVILDDDLALIEGIKDIFRYRAQQQGGSISKQGVKILETLGSFFQEDLESKTRTVILPYFGAIEVQLKSRPSPHETMVLYHNYGPPALPLTPPQVSAEELVGGADATGQQAIPQAPLLDWDVFDDATFQFPMDDSDLNWDHFLFGDELGQWNADMPGPPFEDGDLV